MSQELSVLVVDDDWPMARTLTDVLKLKGYRAEAAYSGPRALDLMEGERFDCVLTDIRMPDVNGVELLRAIRSTRPHMPVVLMTAYAAGELVNEGLREGAIAGFVKPLDIDLLLSFLSVLREQHSIVIADDDSQFWRRVGGSLERLGYSVLEVDDPDDLMKALTPRGQVVFLGARSNGVTGFELLKRIRRRYHALPVVLEADGWEDTSPEVEKARGLNVHAFLRKPFETDDLLEILADIRRRELGTLLRRRPGTLVGQTV